MAFFRCLKVVLVNFITQFAVSAIYEESKRPLEVFNLVPSVSYSREVKRLYEQVSTDTLALSGCQFFFVTRSVILTMVSTIVTYEVVLIQFGSYEPHSKQPNSSIPLYCMEYILPNHTKHL
ncbi:gustatory receptor for sugar taste 64e-like [Macrosteles quadrilineatus]|uniref:gustatory receptor for sugar taste 64e-like n=1 Tax=Macrosteles quadrilineatus TaxID=74068 RepID=UPI0023E28AF1|nr:gustatory receptor for sugar taste 64e-like [Macrosteles quadrilineatus]